MPRYRVVASAPTGRHKLRDRPLVKRGQTSLSAAFIVVVKRLLASSDMLMR